MKDFINKLYQNNAIIYKVLLFFVTTFLIVYLFPKQGQFKYSYTKGTPWQYDNLYAPFDFAIEKTPVELAKEKQQLKSNSEIYFYKKTSIEKEVINEFSDKINSLQSSDSLSQRQIKNLKNLGIDVIHKIYKIGFVDSNSINDFDKNKDLVNLRTAHKVKKVSYKKLTKSEEILPFIAETMNISEVSTTKSYIIEVLSEIIKPNVFYDKVFTEKSLNQKLQKISYTKGKISKGELIIQKGDIIGNTNYNILKSYQSLTNSQKLTQSNYRWITAAYTILVALGLLMVFLFLYQFRREEFNNNNKVTFIFVNILLMVWLQTIILKYNADFLYVVPLTVLPILIKTFFDSRLGLFIHIVTILLLGFIVPNSFEFIYLHIIAGIVTILTIKELYKRANLFISIGKITLTYMLTYIAFSVIKEGGIIKLDTNYFLMFALNGLLSFLAVFFIYAYEKIFGLVSDVSLLELSNTNSKLLRELNEKAPGTFQHSMQVANLAEAAANEIGANSMLVRTGALYHDIGKMANPQYFTENQHSSVNPHGDLSPKDSAHIILDHVIAGIEIAKKNKLPDRIIDFIRTHHGTSLVYYFYKQELDNSSDKQVDVNDFKYKGPIPFSKETAILMMCDAAEAASKSLRTPTAQSIDDLIDKIIEKQKSENQFINSDITFREIEKIKKVIKNKLKNIYHLRIEYPD